MAFYQNFGKIGKKYFGMDILFKYGFNFSPMYRRSTGRILQVSKDLKEVFITIPISYKNKNYVGSIFGGSMFAAVDPIPMVQLIYILGDDFVVWDKTAEIKFKIPAREDLFAKFEYTSDEIQFIKDEVKANQEIIYTKSTHLTNKEGTKTFCEVRKQLYIAEKNHYKNKQKLKRDSSVSE